MTEVTQAKTDQETAADAPPMPEAKGLTELSAGAAPRALALGAQETRFRLDDIYTGIDDPQIMADLAEIESRYEAFSANFRGQLATHLGAALIALENLDRLSNKVTGYLLLVQACDCRNEEIQRVSGQISERLSRAAGHHGAFFEIEVGKLSDKTYAELLAGDQRVARYNPMLARVREQAKYQLSEEVERALSIRRPFGISEWSELVQDREAAMRFPMKSEAFKGEEFDGKDLRLEEALTIMSEHPERQARAETLRIVNQTLKDGLMPFMGRALNLVAGEKNLDDAERGFKHTMSARNITNMVPDKVVDALHASVADTGSALSKRYYRLLAQHLGVEKLAWSDRNAPLPGSERIIPWCEAQDIVMRAYASFSPTLAGLVQKIIDAGWVDAPTCPGKRSGAFNLGLVMPEPHGVRAYTFLNYLGKPGDVSTFAHELGHGVHALLAGNAQGSLMYHAPIAYCETASIFAEMVTFNYLKELCSTPQEKLALLMDKIKDFMNTVVRQIGFSNFEQRVHGARKEGKLTSEMFNKFWMETVEQLYGKDGEVFEYKDMENLWSYVSHFLRPFYVYGYAFGELLTQSLYSIKDSYGDKFEPLYLDLLKAGATKDVIELLKPFGLDPCDPEFWSRGMEASVGRWLDEAEALSRQTGIGAGEA